MTSQNFSKKLQGGYGGIELLLTVVIAGILLGLAVVQFANIQARHRDNERRKDMAILQQKVAGFYAIKGYYPISLAQLKDLPAEACRAPGDSGTCTNSNYTYKAFKPGTNVGPDSNTNCNNNKPASICVDYIIYTNHMEKANNPYLVRSY